MTTEEQTPLLIACGILREEILALRNQGRLKVFAHFLSSRLHKDPAHLGKALTASMGFFRRKFDRRIVVVYGDACLGFHGEMARLVEAYGLIKVKAVNCIDCHLGGGGHLLELDPEHEYFFLNKAFLDFGCKSLFKKDPATVREQFRKLTAIIPIDTMGDLNSHWIEIRRVGDITGLPIRKPLNVGLSGVQTVLVEAISRLPVSDPSNYFSIPTLAGVPRS
jgi:hypothetical protein